MRILLVALLAATLTGCGTLVPKKVELFQDKVQKFPQESAREREIRRQAAERAAREARELLEQSIEKGADTNVLKKAKDTAVLTDAVSDNLGPPLKPSKDKAEKLADELNSATTKLDERRLEFAEDNDENAGKKIEGTGLIRVSYFAWVGGFLVLAFLGFIALKVISTLGAAANPAVGLGLNTITGSAKSVAKALGQVVKGGKNFLREVDRAIPDEALAEKIKEIFIASQKEAQDDDVKDAVKKLIKE